MVPKHGNWWHRLDMMEHNRLRYVDMDFGDGLVWTAVVEGMLLDDAVNCETAGHKRCWSTGMIVHPTGVLITAV